MAETTPARITYFIGEAEQDIRFHCVISEAHQATSEITKFPVQTGFQVSNHAIRHNRKITIEAVISNTLIEGGGESYEYSLSDNSQTVFKALRDLVNLRLQTTVQTNLGIYTPVVFTSFKTKQAAGSVDSMKILLTGEELQVSNAVNGAAPTPISWTLVEDPDRQAVVDQMKALGLTVKEGDKIEQATASIGGDFVLRSTNDLNQTYTTTYICKGYDPTTGIYSYDVHTTDLDKYETPETLATAVGGIQEPLSQKAGAQGFHGCLVDNPTEVITEADTAEYNTAAGTLKASTRGAFYSTQAMANRDKGQELIGLSAGCAIRTSTGDSSEIPYSPGETTPSASEIISGARNVGTNVNNTNKTPSNIPLLDIVLTQVTDRSPG